jgi:type II secretory pathway pseudopilin PulG
VKTSPCPAASARTARGGFSAVDLLAVLAVLFLGAAIATPILQRSKGEARLQQCLANLRQIGQAVALYAEDNKATLPMLADAPAPGGWWFYKDQIKNYLTRTGGASAETVFACPVDRGYGEAGNKLVPFFASPKHNRTSYVFNGVNLPGIPNIAGWKTSEIKNPERTLLVMEWTAHAPLSWHRSRTRQRNTPFYQDAESVVTFADGHVKLIPIYFDGMNAAYTRDPIGGYEYKYSGD